MEIVYLALVFIAGLAVGGYVTVVYYRTELDKLKKTLNDLEHELKVYKPSDSQPLGLTMWD